MNIIILTEDQTVTQYIMAQNPPDEKIPTWKGSLNKISVLLLNKRKALT
jgi:hypothetical protein